MPFAFASPTLPTLRAASPHASICRRATPSTPLRPARAVRSHQRSRFTMTIAQGAPAPDFTKTDGDGKTITLSSFKGERNVVLYFSNGAGPGCTSQSCQFRDEAEDFAALDAEIISVSAQRDVSAFKTENRLPFSVISDPDGELRKLYEVPATLGLIPGRVTYVIDKKGVIRNVFNSQFSTAAHVKTAKETLESIS